MNYDAENLYPESIFKKHNNLQIDSLKIERAWHKRTLLKAANPLNPGLLNPRIVWEKPSSYSKKHKFRYSELESKCRFLLPKLSRLKKKSNNIIQSNFYLKEIFIANATICFTANKNIFFFNHMAHQQIKSYVIHNVHILILSIL